MVNRIESSLDKGDEKDEKNNVSANEKLEEVNRQIEKRVAETGVSEHPLHSSEKAPDESKRLRQVREELKIQAEKEVELKNARQDAERVKSRIALEQERMQAEKELKKAREELDRVMRSEGKQ